MFTFLPLVLGIHAWQTMSFLNSVCRPGSRELSVAFSTDGIVDSTPGLAEVTSMS